ncbi:MAG: hypothetical protein KAQ94_04450 [Arcobacteraceae bacterium]|nr:hypothetical protein [Arcobacteraceae bacterium]
MGSWTIEFIQTKDGSNTLYSQRFEQYFHSVKEGALNESLYKHIVPALQHHKNKNELNILDICFGLGYNTLATIYYIKKNNINIKLNIYSPEFDTELLHSLPNFQYPKEFLEFKYIIDKISQTFRYQDKNINIEVFNGDAREYIKTLSNIHIVYQDAFSSDVNKSLWTKEYFNDIYKLLDKDAIITTYSIATPIRLSMYENNLFIYEYKNDFTNRITIAMKNKFTIEPSGYKYIDMELKKQRNSSAKPLRDLD